MIPLSSYICPGCGKTASTITCYAKTGNNEYAWRSRIGVIHEDGCWFLARISLFYPRLVQHIEEERGYGKQTDTLAS